MIQKPLVSIITPLYNSEKYIGETIESVLNQSYSNWEMIIIDDQSSDNGVEIVEKYKKLDERIKLFLNDKNIGVSDSRNRGIESSKGKYIAFLDSDDLWKKNKLEIQIKFMEENRISISYTAYEKLREVGKNKSKIEVPNKINYKKLLKGNLMGCLTVIIKKDFLGTFRFKNIKQEDYVLWLELLKETDYAYGIEESLAYYRILKNSRSSNKIKLALFNFYIHWKIEKLNFIKASYYYLNYIVRGFIRFMK